MGELIEMAERRVAHRPRSRARNPGRPSVQFLFDLSDPWTYLVAERIDRALPAARWTPASSFLVKSRSGAPAAERARCRAEARARALGLPLEWPDRYPAEVPDAMRVAAYASEQGRGAPFALAAGRLAFCGGFDLDDPEVLAEAAAAAGIGPVEAFAAARDAGRDEAIAAAGCWLPAGAGCLPALRSGGHVACGEAAISAIALTARLRLAAL